MQSGLQEIIIVRFGELFLKGNNRSFFENLLIKNIKSAVKKFDISVHKGRGRYIVHGFDQSSRNAVMDALKKVFGIHSLSFAKQTASDAEKIYQLCREHVRPGSFKVQTKRADKTFAYNSMEFSSYIGGRLLGEFSDISVDVHSPEYVINIDLREDGTTFVYADVIAGAGGMPVGSSAKGMLMLSGGIDSPVAGYMMARRGMNLCAVHYHSHPYTSEHSRQKVITLAEKLAEYCGGIKLYVVPFTEIQQEIHKHCRAEYMITIMRRYMMEIAQILAERENAGAIINGESLGQVASQTMESITVTNDVVSMPVFRPLIGLDKIDIIKTAEKIGTYNTSILPYEDCCTIFLPKNPIIKPKLKFVKEQESALSRQSLIDAAILGTEVIEL